MDRGFEFLGAVAFMLFAVIAESAAQSVLIVGPGGFPDVNSAYAAAAPGDTILVRAAEVPDFQLAGKGVNIIGEGTATAVITNTSLAACHSIRGIPAGQRLYIRNLRFDMGDHAPVSWAVLMIQDCQGAVVLDEVTARLGGYYPEGRRGVMATRCALLECFDCDFTGGAGMRPPRVGSNGTATDGGAALEVIASTLALSRCSLTGGAGGTPPTGASVVATSGGDALTASGSRITAVECSFTGGASNPVVSASVHPGWPMNLRGCQATISGLPAQTILADVSSALHTYGSGCLVQGGASIVSDPSPLQSLTASYSSSASVLSVDSTSGPPLGITALGISFQPFYFATEPLGHLGTILIDLDRSRSFMLSAFQYDASGAWSGAFPVPPSAASTHPHLVLFLQAYTLTSSGRLRISAADAVHP